MSVRSALLSILTLGPCYGLQLAGEFERRTGGAEPLRDAQVYTTLDRLERDGAVRALAKDDSGRVRYELTREGRREAERWLASPVAAETSGARDELALKLTLAATLPGADLAGVMAAQREAARAALEALAGAEPDDALDRVVLARRRTALEAELDWLDEASRILAHVSPFPLAPPPKRGRKARHAE